MNARYYPNVPDQMFIIHINPEDIRRHNPLVSAIDDFIDRHVSLASFSSKCINSIKGHMIMGIIPIVFIFHQIIVLTAGIKVNAKIISGQERANDLMLRVNTLIHSLCEKG